MFKYIILSDGSKEMPVMFSKQLIHSDVAKGVKDTYEDKPLYVVSAGFIGIRQANNLLGVEFTAYGRSDSLNLESRITDGATITNHPYTHGIN